MSIFATYPPKISGLGIQVYPTFADFPASAPNGTLALALDTDFLYVYSTGSSSWILIAGAGTILSVGTIDSQTPSANGAVIHLDQLIMQSASATVPGLVNLTSQTFAGSKTFTGSVLTSTVDTAAAGTLALGTGNATVINLGNSGTTVNITGSTIFEHTTQLQVSDPLMTLNVGGGVGSASNSGIEIEENSVITGYVETSGDRNSWILKAPNTAGIVTVTPGVSGFTLNQGSHNPVTLGTANGLSLSTQVLSLALSSTSTTGALSSTDWNTFNNKQSTITTGNLTDVGTDGITVTGGTGAIIGSGTSISQHVAGASNNGYLSSTDWSTFNSKQPAGSYITALTGDVAASGPGSVAATIQSNVVTNAKLAQMATLTIKGNNTGLTANALDLTVAQVNAILPVFTSSLNGLTPFSGGGTTNFLRADGTWAVPTGSSTGTVTSVTFTGDGTVLSSTPSSAVTTSGTVTASLNTQAKNTFLAGPQTGSNDAPTFRVLGTADFVAPTVQKFTSSSGTYTTPTSPRLPLYIQVIMVGAGGGGGGSGTAGTAGNGGIGGNTTFGTTLLVANGGSGGIFSGAGGAGGSASLGTGPIGTALTGGSGGGDVSNNGSTNIYIPGGLGASSALGGGGGPSQANTAGTNGVTNTGGGASGGGTVGGVFSNSGGGGGAGGYVNAIISAPSATYAYAVGTGGLSGTTGTSGFAGGAGGSGYIEVREFYQ